MFPKGIQKYDLVRHLSMDVPLPKEFLNLAILHSEYQNKGISPKRLEPSSIEKGYYITHSSAQAVYFYQGSYRHELYSRNLILGKDKISWTLLMRASQANSVKIVDQLLNYGLDPYKKDELNNDSFEICQLFKSKKVHQVLKRFERKLQTGMSICNTDNFSNVILHYQK